MATSAVQSSAFQIWKRPNFWHDLSLIPVMGILAGCGLIYEYLISHYAGRILGTVESTIFAMIGVMIVSMGIGAFYARVIKQPFNGFVWLEVGIAFLGGISILLMAAVYSVAHTLPMQIQEIYGIDSSVDSNQALVISLKRFAEAVPFVTGFALGFMVGMEIPLIARIREQVHGQHLKNNAGTIYGADYIGAGIGAALWVTICLQSPIMVVAAATASANALMGVFFLIRYGKYITGKAALWLVHGVILAMLGFLLLSGEQIMQGLNNTLFKDTVVYSKNTKYQHLTITERFLAANLPKVHSLYINGRLQFASNDEGIYHSMLTYPPLLASARTDRILVVGGGDGMAVRDILRWNPETVTLLDLDEGMLQLFNGADAAAPTAVSERLLALNESALSDHRVSVVQGDAFKSVEALVGQQLKFDTIIVDLPDPSHPDLNKLYSDYFYGKLRELLSGDGAIAIQSTSPYHAKKAFMSIGKTLSAAGFNTQQYHTNVPSFGEWGWTIGTIHGKSASQRIEAVSDMPVKSDWISLPLMGAAFAFTPKFYSGLDLINVNTIGSNSTYQYHLDGWKQDKGVFVQQ